MSNPFDDWQNLRGFSGATNNKTGTLSNVSVALTMTTGGWWKISADVDFHWQGWKTTAGTCTTSDQHEWAKDSVVIYVPAGKQLSILRSGSTSGTYWANRIAGV